MWHTHLQHLRYVVVYDCLLVTCCSCICIRSPHTYGSVCRNTNTRTGMTYIANSVHIQAEGQPCTCISMSCHQHLKLTAGKTCCTSRLCFLAYSWHCSPAIAVHKPALACVCTASIYCLWICQEFVCHAVRNAFSILVILWCTQQQGYSYSGGFCWHTLLEARLVNGNTVA